MQNSVISTWIIGVYRSQPSSVFFASQTAPLDQNYKSLWVPDLTCPFVHAKQRDLQQNDKFTWVPALICGFCKQNSDFWIRITNLYGSQTSPVVFACTTAGITSELLVSMGPSPLQWFLHAKSVISIRITSLYVSQPSCLVFGCKATTFWPE